MRCSEVKGKVLRLSVRLVFGSLRDPSAKSQAILKLMAVRAGVSAEDLLGVRSSSLEAF